MISIQKVGRLILGHADSVVVITTRLLWSYVINATNIFIQSVLPPQEVPPCMGYLFFAKNVKGKLSMKALGT